MSRYKTCRVLESHGVEQYNDQLIERWTAPKPQRKGYRQLACWLNVALLRQGMDGAGLSTLVDDRLRTIEYCEKFFGEYFNSAS